MNLYISGSLAYDRIMNFEGRFADHIMPDKIHVLNVSFNVNGLQEKLGGTAGNIAYGLAQLNENPKVLGCLGQDGAKYLAWMEKNGIDATYVRTIESEFTAGAFITTDMDNNQITPFNPGAMAHSCCFDASLLDPADSLAIVAPNSLDEMKNLCRSFKQRNIPFIFDPGQSLNIWSGPDLVEAMDGARLLTSNDYELEMICRRTGRDLDGIMELVQAVITTKGEDGCLLRDNGEERPLPAAPSDAVKDPTGAGDAFRAGLMKAMGQGLDLEEACLWGAAIASFAVACHGTQEYELADGQFEERLAMVKKLAETA